MYILLGGGNRELKPSTRKNFDTYLELIPNILKKINHVSNFHLLLLIFKHTIAAIVSN